MSIDQLRMISDQIVAAERLAHHAQGAREARAARRQITSLRRTARKAAAAYRGRTRGR